MRLVWFTTDFISVTPLSGLPQCKNLQCFFLELVFVYCLMSLDSFVFFILRHSWVWQVHTHRGERFLFSERFFMCFEQVIGNRYCFIALFSLLRLVGIINLVLVFRQSFENRSKPKYLLLFGWGSSNGKLQERPHKKLTEVFKLDLPTLLKF